MTPQEELFIGLTFFIVALTFVGGHWLWKKLTKPKWDCSTQGHYPTIEYRVWPIDGKEIRMYDCPNCYSSYSVKVK